MSSLKDTFEVSTFGYVAVEDPMFDFFVESMPQSPDNDQEIVDFVLNNYEGFQSKLVTVGQMFKAMGEKLISFAKEEIEPKLYRKLMVECIRVRDKKRSSATADDPPLL